MSKELAQKQDLPVVAKEITPMTIIQSMVEKGSNPDELMKMLELQERWEANEAKKAYVVAMARFRKDCPKIEKTRKVKFDTQKGTTAYNHAGLAETIETIKSLMADCGLSHSWRTSQADGLVEVSCCVTHVMGHSECTKLMGSPDSSGGKNSIQAIASTVSYLERYTLFAILGLASEEMDDDGAKGVPAISEEQANEIHAKITDNGLDMNAFIGWLEKTLKCNSIEEINQNGYGTVINTLNTSIANKAKKK